MQIVCTAGHNGKGRVRIVEILGRPVFVSLEGPAATHKKVIG